MIERNKELPVNLSFQMLNLRVLSDTVNKYVSKEVSKIIYVRPFL